MRWKSRFKYLWSSLISILRREEERKKAAVDRWRGRRERMTIEKKLYQKPKMTTFKKKNEKQIEDQENPAWTVGCSLLLLLT